MKLWTITTDQDGVGTATIVHTSEAEADAHYGRIVAASWESWLGDTRGLMPDDAKEAWGILTDQVGFLDGVALSEHEIALPVPADVAARCAHRRHVYGKHDADANTMEIQAAEIARLATAVEHWRQEVGKLHSNVARLTGQNNLARECIANLEGMHVRDEADIAAMTTRADGAEAAHAATKAALDEAMRLLTLIRDDGPSWQSDHAARILAKHGSQT